MTDPIYFAEPNTADFYAEPLPLSATGGAFQSDAFQFDAFQIVLGSKYTFLEAEPNTDIFYAERRVGT